MVLIVGSERRDRPSVAAATARPHGVAGGRLPARGASFGEARNGRAAAASLFESNAGGKLIMWHGWADPAITPIGTIAYYQAVQDRMGGPAATARLCSPEAP